MGRYVVGVRIQGTCDLTHMIANVNGRIAYHYGRPGMYDDHMLITWETSSNGGYHSAMPFRWHLRQRVIGSWSRPQRPLLQEFSGEPFRVQKFSWERDDPARCVLFPRSRRGIDLHPSPQVQPGRRVILRFC